jgi:hypothetical protein
METLFVILCMFGGTCEPVAMRQHVASELCAEAVEIAPYAPRPHGMVIIGAYCAVEGLDV